LRLLHVTATLPAPSLPIPLQISHLFRRVGATDSDTITPEVNDGFWEQLIVEIDPLCKVPNYA